MASEKRVNGSVSPFIKLAAERVAASGLTVPHAKLLRLEPVPDANKLHPSFDPRPGLKIPYYDPADPKRALTGWPKMPPYYRLRYLGDPIGFQRTTLKPPRYVQPPDQPPCAYYPLLPDLDWHKIRGNKDIILMTEGELKAAKACTMKYNCIGLGGVWSYRSAEWGMRLLPEIKWMQWMGREVFLIYDSDAKDNPHIIQAARALGNELRDLGARPYYVCLPDALDGGAKTGLDDFLMQAGSASLDSILLDAKPFTLADPLFALNRRLVFVMNPGLILEADSGQKMNLQTFNANYANITIAERIPVNDGYTLETKPASTEWLAWPLRRQATQLVYAPGQPQTVDGAWNTWAGWGLEPKRGDIAPFVKLVDHLMSSASKDDRTWFWRWLAYPLQHPGTKMFCAVVFHGTTTGTGKSMIAEIMARIYGKNYKMIRQSDLHTDFNAWAENRQFVFGDEISSNDRRQDADLLKNMITQETIDINIKHVPQFSIVDRINYYFASNHPDAFFLADQDRRFFINEVVLPPLPFEFYLALRAWKNSEAGPAALFYHLLHLNLGDFDPAAPAPWTAAKSRMVASVRSDAGAWVAQLREDPDSILKFGGVTSARDLWTAAELHALYDPKGTHRITAVGIGRELSKAGFRQVLDGAAVRANGERQRYFAVRNMGDWLKARQEDCRRHLEGKPVAAKVKKFVRPEG